jgi:hypothetical protein
VKDVRFRAHITDLPQHIPQIYAVREFPFTKKKKKKERKKKKNGSPIDPESFTAR